MVESFLIINKSGTIVAFDLSQSFDRPAWSKRIEMHEGEQIREIRVTDDGGTKPSSVLIMTAESLILLDALDGVVQQRVQFRNFELITIKHFDLNSSFILAKNKFKEDPYLLKCETSALKIFYIAQM